MEFAVLSSGSKANCLYVGTSNTKVLIDCGLSAKEAERRLVVSGVKPEEIKAIVVTHEHRDHVAGIPVFCKRRNVQVYANRLTRSSSSVLETISNGRFDEFVTGQVFKIGELEFEPFSIAHDAADPVAFRITDGRQHLCVVTDLGQVTTLVEEKTQNVDAIVLESNHDPKMLQECSYPWELKQRISSRTGHLSNSSAGRLLGNIRTKSSLLARYIIAGHISENSNRPELALRTLQTAWQESGGGETRFFAASPYSPCPVISL